MLLLEECSEPRQVVRCYGVEVPLVAGIQFKSPELSLQHVEMIISRFRIIVVVEELFVYREKIVAVLAQRPFRVRVFVEDLREPLRSEERGVRKPW